MPKVNDRGARALAERLERVLYWDTPGLGKDPILPEMVVYYERMAQNAMGTTGLFIADVTKHKPYARLDRALVEGDYEDQRRVATLTCSCGWVQSFGMNGAESYFDHIGSRR